MQQTIDRLSRHAFNLIGLSDREKFHTGMLAFTLRWLLQNEPELGCKLIDGLWGAKERVDWSGADELQVQTEASSLDLVLRRGKQITHWAEVKLKTGLRESQIQDYEAKSPDAYGVLLGLLPEPTFSERTVFRSFADVVCANLHDSALAELTARYPENDSILLIRMWAEYLIDLGGLSRSFVERKLNQVPEPDAVLECLKAIKLAGIFERYRYGLVLASIGAIDPRVVKTLFNSNGNAGLDFRIEAPRPYGLQWQAGALKLFVEEPQFKKGLSTPERDAFLHDLAKRYTHNFDIPAPEKINVTGKFRSITIARWKVFDDCGQRIQELKSGIDFLCSLRAELCK